MVDDPQLRSLINAELQRGEKLLWVGKPTPLRVVMQNREVVIVGVLLLIVMICVLFIFPNAHVFSVNLVGLGFSFGWILLIFVLLGLTYFARPIYDYFMARRTIYAVTDRRALILKGRLRGRKALSYRQLEQVKRRDQLNGRGDLIFGSETYVVRRSSGVRVRTRKIGFFGIENAREVEALLLEHISGTDPQKSL